MSEDEIEKIRRSLSVAREIKRSATDWTEQAGGDRVGRCTHPEHGHTSSAGGTPNLIVTDDGGWYCYSHSTGGGIFEWIAVEEEICSCGDLPLTDSEFTEALEEAADRAGVELTSSGPDSYEEAKDDSRISDEEKARYALDKAVDILHDNLDAMIGDQNVRGVIKDKRPFDDEMIDEARIGYLNAQAHADLLEELSQQALQDIGLHRDNNSLHVRDRIIYPYLDDRGQARYWTGRATEETESDAKYKKPRNDTCVLEQPIHVYSGDDAREGEPVWIVEGIQDAMALGENGGVKAITAVATNPSTFQTNQIIEQAQEAGSAVVCFDPDDGGQKDSIDLALELMSAGVQTSMVNLPEGTDPNDYFYEGNDFSDLEVKPAAKAIIEARGDSDAMVERILSTTAPETPRAERLVDALADVTPLRKTVLRKMMEEEREYEDQRGWREPIQVKKTKGADTTWTFVYPDGSEIEMDRVYGYGIAQEFANKYASVFNFIPDFDDDEFREKANEWLREVRKADVDPLSQEGLCRDKILSSIQSATAVPTRDDLAATGVDGVVVDESDGEVLVPSQTVESWIEDKEYSLRQVSEYLEPFMAGETRRLRLGGKRMMWWPFDLESIEDEGYVVPEPKAAPEDSDGDDEDEGVKTL